MQAAKKMRIAGNVTPPVTPSNLDSLLADVRKNKPSAMESILQETHIPMSFGDEHVASNMQHSEDDETTQFYHKLVDYISIC